MTGLWRGLGKPADACDVFWAVQQLLVVNLGGLWIDEASWNYQGRRVKYTWRRRRQPMFLPKAKGH
jgi:hypothetical protein